MKYKDFQDIIKKDAKFNIAAKPQTIDVSKYIKDMPKEKKLISMRALMLSFSSVLFLLALAAFGYINLNPVATISIDVNPSLRVDLNVFDRITKVYADNKDAIELTAAVNLKNMKIDDAINAIYNYENNQNQLTNNRMYMLLGIYSDNSETATKLDDMLNFNPEKIVTLKITEMEITSYLQTNSTVTSTMVQTTTAQAVTSTTPAAEYDSTTTADSVSAVDGSSTTNQSTDTTTSTTTTLPPEPPSPDQIVNASQTYGISEAKLIVITKIITTANDYNDVSDIPILINMDLPMLFQLYYESGGQ